MNGTQTIMPLVPHHAGASHNIVLSIRPYESSKIINKTYNKTQTLTLTNYKYIFNLMSE
jgi:hypothetical protein